MCGIAGILDPKIEQKEAILGDMVAKIIHRGPDDDGFYVDKYVGLGMRRLSIIDLATGRQPVTSEDGKLLIFFNGEIYNYKELKGELIKKNYSFKTNSDTEVVLTMFQAYGEKMLTMLRGMFAFVIYDTEAKKVFIARDFFGIKPLYYLTSGNQITAFGSEIKSFFSIPSFKAEVNDSAVFNYLSYQYNPLAETFFKNVYKLPPGHLLTVDLNSNHTEIKQYWSFEFGGKTKLSEKEVAEKIKGVMKDSVAHHMIADVPVGAFLSGGIDSSIIATLMQEVRGDKKIKTFTVGFEGLSEGREARETAKFLGTDHKEITVTKKDYFDSLKDVVYHFDEPVADPSAVGLYFVSKEAKKHVKVVLSGEGSDELFGGYNIYLAPIARQKMVWLPKFIVNLAISLPFEYFGKNYLRRVSMKLEDWYIGNASIFKDDEVAKLWKGKGEKKFSLSSLYKKVQNQSDSTQMQYIDINTWLPGDILAKADKMTMTQSLELRVPFLDTQVSQLAQNLPDSHKWQGGQTKYLLRKAFKSVIPETTRNRRKLGFPTPLSKWLTKDSREFYYIILNNEYIKKKMDMNYVEKLINDHNSGAFDNSRKIYLLLALSLWYDIFIKS